jgi:hypothetical protein
MDSWNNKYLRTGFIQLTGVHQLIALVESIERRWKNQKLMKALNDKRLFDPQHMFTVWCTWQNISDMYFFNQPPIREDLRFQICWKKQKSRSWQTQTKLLRHVAHSKQGSMVNLMLWWIFEYIYHHLYSTRIKQNHEGLGALGNHNVIYWPLFNVVAIV